MRQYLHGQTTAKGNVCTNQAMQLATSSNFFCISHLAIDIAFAPVQSPFGKAVFNTALVDRGLFGNGTLMSLLQVY